MAGIAVGNVFTALALQVWRKTSTGIAVGQLDPDNLGTNVTSHALKVPGLITTTLPQPTYENVIFRGDQTILGQADIGVSAYGTFEVNITGLNATLAALLAGGSVDTTSLINATIAAPNTGKIAPNQLGMMLTAQIQDGDPESATFGDNKYISYIFPNIQGRYNFPNVSQSGGENPNPGVLTITPSRLGTFPGGNAMGSNQGWTDNKELMYTITADNPYALTAFVGDGAATTYTVKYVPASTDVASGNTTNWFTVNAVVTAPTSISAAGLVTVAVAVPSGQVAVALYQTADSFTPN